MRDRGAGVKYTVGGFEYESRSGLLFGFLRGCIQEGVWEDLIFALLHRRSLCRQCKVGRCPDQAAAGINPIGFLSDGSLSAPKRSTLHIPCDTGRHATI